MSPSNDGYRQAILDAAADLLRHGGIGAVTTRAVAHAANVQAPAIYRLFTDKNGLLDAVSEHVMSTYATDKAAALRHDVNRDPVEALRAGWQAHIEFGVRNPDLFMLLNAPGRLTRSPASRTGVEVLEERVHRLAMSGKLRVPEERAVFMILAAGTGAVFAILADHGSADNALTDRLFDALLAAIVSEQPDHDVSSIAAIALTFAATIPQVPGLSAAERALMTEWLARAIDQLNPQ